MSQSTRATSSQECARCHIHFKSRDLYVVVEGIAWHPNCFRCAQCFLPLHNDTYFNFGDRYYCQHDFEVLFAPICTKCNSFVIGHVMSALNGYFHPKCFSCENCEGNLDMGVWYIDGRMMCFTCKESMPKIPHYYCNKCHQRIPQDEILEINNDFFHAYHFDCSDCKKVLTRDARVHGKTLYCLRCYDLRCDICTDCKMPIDKEHERSITVMGKHWHLDHFRCVKCGNPFQEQNHFEKNGKAYCKEDYLKIFGDYCHRCTRGLTGESVRLFSKGWCRQCYRCIACDKQLDHKDRVLEWDMRPMCKKCFYQKDFYKIVKQATKEEKNRSKVENK